MLRSRVLLTPTFSFYKFIKYSTGFDVLICSLCNCQDAFCPQASMKNFNSCNESYQDEHGVGASGQGLSQVECLSKKGNSMESDMLKAGLQEKTGWKRNGTSNEAEASTSGQDIVQGKTKTQLPKGRQTQSGPLLPGTVLSHSLSERVRGSERFVLFHGFMFISLIIFWIVS